MGVWTTVFEGDAVAISAAIGTTFEQFLATGQYSLSGGAIKRTAYNGAANAAIVMSQAAKTSFGYNRYRITLTTLPLAFPTTAEVGIAGIAASTSNTDSLQGGAYLQSGQPNKLRLWFANDNARVSFSEANTAFTAGQPITITYEQVSVDTSGNTVTTKAYTSSATTDSVAHNRLGSSTGKIGFLITGADSDFRANNGITYAKIEGWDEAGTPPQPATLTVAETTLTSNIRNSGSATLNLTATGTSWTTQNPPALSLTQNGAGASLSNLTVTSGTTATVTLNVGTSTLFSIAASTGGSAEVLLLPPITRTKPGTVGKIDLSIPLPNGSTIGQNLTYQWLMRQGTTGSTFANVINGTSNALSLAVDDDLLRLFYCDVTHGSRTVRISHDENGKPAGASRVIPSVPTFLPISALSTYTGKFGFAGDSIMTDTVAGSFCAAIQTVTGNAATFINAGRGGTRFEDWLKTAPSAGNSLAQLEPYKSQGKNLYQSFVEGIKSINAPIGIIALGTNNIDSTTDVVLANAASFFDRLNEDLPGVQFFVNHTIYRGATPTQHDNLDALAAGLETLISARSAWLHKGAWYELEQFFAANYPASYNVGDSTHLNGTGGTQLGKFDAVPVINYLVANYVPPTPPTVTTQPTNQTGTVGGSATFTATFAGAINAKAQKFVSNAWADQGSASLNSTTGVATFTKNNLATGDAGSYRLVGTNAQGDKETNAITLTVSAVPDPDPVVTSVMLDQAGPIDVAVGGSTQLTASVFGSGNYSQAKTWSLSQAIGSISNTGLYTAPTQSTEDDRSVVVRVASAVNSTAYDELTIHIPGVPAGGGDTDLSEVLAALAALSAKVDALSPAPGVVIPGDVRFEFDLVSNKQQLATSTEFVILAVRAFRGPVPMYAPDYTVKIAITSTSAAPQDDDFRAASWNQDGLSALLVGPANGAVTLTPGTYFVHAKVSNAPEVTVARVGLLTVL